MPVEKTILPDHRMVYSRWSKEILAEDIVEAEISYPAMKGYAPDQLYIVDLRQVEGAEIEFTEIDSILNLVRQRRAAASPLGANAIKAVVLAPDDLTFGMTRQFQAVAETRGGVSIRIYRDEADLTSDIGQPGQTLQGLVQPAVLH
ncbi:MAG: hypothetical protein AAF503_15345 [Pseudomonadota bacterium]